VIEKNELERAVKTARKNYPIFSVKMLNPLRIRLIITGNEVYNGLIQDKFQTIVEKKTKALGATLKETVILPDNREKGILQNCATEGYAGTANHAGFQHVLLENLS